MNKAKLFTRSIIGRGCDGINAKLIIYMGIFLNLHYDVLFDDVPEYGDAAGEFASSGESGCNSVLSDSE